MGIPAAQWLRTSGRSLSADGTGSAGSRATQPRQTSLQKAYQIHAAAKGAEQESVSTPGFPEERGDFWKHRRAAGEQKTHLPPFGVAQIAPVGGAIRPSGWSDSHHTLPETQWSRKDATGPPTRRYSGKKEFPAPISGNLRGGSVFSTTLAEKVGVWPLTLAVRHQRAVSRGLLHEGHPQDADVAGVRQRDALECLASGNVVGVAIDVRASGFARAARLITNRVDHIRCSNQRLAR